MKLLFIFALCMVLAPQILEAYSLKYKAMYYSFNTPSDTFYLPKVSNVQTSGITSCIWFLPTRTSIGHDRTLFHYVTDVGRLKGFQLSTRVERGNKKSLVVNIGGAEKPLVAPFDFTVMRWNHVCVVWYKGDVILYKDGKRLNEFPYKLFNSLKFPRIRESSLVLGQETQDVNVKLGIKNPYTAFQGVLSGLYIWQSYLTPDQISSVYRKDDSMPRSNLIADWYLWGNRRLGGGKSVRWVIIPDNERNECLDGSHKCNDNALCTDTRNSYTCSCKVGFQGDGFTCEDVNECLLDLHQCSANAECINSFGSYSCRCNVGYKGDGYSCSDVDECNLDAPVCDENAACSNTEGSFYCACNVGYDGDGFSCVDIDECQSGAHRCDGNAACTNSAGSYSCKCNTGYEGDGRSCTDIDECSRGTDQCDDNASCLNNPGSYFCSCNIGFDGNGRTCTDIDECNRGTDECDQNALCSNSFGSYTCTCNVGYEGSGRSCTDIDECSRGTHACDDNASCSNTLGSYSCSCNEGYEGNGRSCTDIDECSVGTNECDINAACTNNAGSYSCKCNIGYEGSGRLCTDINECSVGTDECDVNAACTNNAGSYTCKCNTGYEGSGRSCTDIDECSVGTDECDVNAACTNNAGSYTCKCNTGYEGSGRLCTDIDECSRGTHACDDNAACSNTLGSYSCSCNEGYEGDGRYCRDIDECEAGANECSGNAACTNTAGSYDCTCNDGYQGDGRSCVDINECATGVDECAVGKTCVNTVGSYFCRGKDMNFGVKFDTYSSRYDVPYIKDLRNPRTEGLGMCMWYKLSKKPGSGGRYLFHYTGDSSIFGFTVFLRNNDRLVVKYSVDYETKVSEYTTNLLNEWTHLCVSVTKGKLSTYSHGRLMVPSGIELKYSKKVYPEASSALLVLGQQLMTNSVPGGVMRTSRAFQGEISQFMLYSRPLIEQDVRSSYYKDPSFKNAIVSWDMWKGVANKVTIKEVSYDQLPF